MKSASDTRQLVKMFFYGALISLFATKMVACGVVENAQGSSAMAYEIPGPNGVRCFVIVDNGQPVGGNCK